MLGEWLNFDFEGSSIRSYSFRLEVLFYFLDSIDYLYSFYSSLIYFVLLYLGSSLWGRVGIESYLGDSSGL